MSIRGRFVHLTIAVAAAALVPLIGGGPRASAQGCAQEARAVRATPLYATAPEFVTGRGLVYGRQIAVLQPGIRVYVCDRRTVGWGFSSQLWYRVAFWNRGWVYAWGAGTDIRPERTGGRDLRPGLARAMAAPVPGPPAVPPAGVVPVAPPPDAGPPPGPPDVAVRRDEAALLEFYAWCFGAMLMGMVAKALVDVLESAEPVRLGRLVRRAGTPLFVSPVVFLGFMQSAGLEVKGITGFLVLLCLAFQNGFFWQTVMNVKRSA